MSTTLDLTLTVERYSKAPFNRHRGSSPLTPRHRPVWRVPSFTLSRSFISLLQLTTTRAKMSFQLPAGMRPAQAPGQQGGNGNDDPERAERAAQQAEVKRNMIQAMLEPAARERREYRECGGGVKEGEGVGSYRQK